MNRFIFYQIRANASMLPRDTNIGRVSWQPFKQPLYTLWALVFLKIVIFCDKSNKPIDCDGRLRAGCQPNWRDVHVGGHKNMCSDFLKSWVLVRLHKRSTHDICACIVCDRKPENTNVPMNPCPACSIRCLRRSVKQWNISQIFRKRMISAPNLFFWHALTCWFCSATFSDPILDFEKICRDIVMNIWDAE